MARSDRDRDRDRRDDRDDDDDDDDDDEDDDPLANIDTEGLSSREKRELREAIRNGSAIRISREGPDIVLKERPPPDHISEPRGFGSAEVNDALIAAIQLNAQSDLSYGDKIRQSEALQQAWQAAQEAYSSGRAREDVAADYVRWVGNQARAVVENAPPTEPLIRPNAEIAGTEYQNFEERIQFLASLNLTVGSTGAVVPLGPAGRSFEQIWDREYLSDAEREWYLNELGQTVGPGGMPDSLWQPIASQLSPAAGVGRESLPTILVDAPYEWIIDEPKPAIDDPLSLLRATSVPAPGTEYATDAAREAYLFDLLKQGVPISADSMAFLQERDAMRQLVASNVNAYNLAVHGIRPGDDPLSADWVPDPPSVLAQSQELIGSFHDYLLIESFHNYLDNKAALEPLIQEAMAQIQPSAPELSGAELRVAAYAQLQRQQEILTSPPPSWPLGPLAFVDDVLNVEFPTPSFHPGGDGFYTATLGERLTNILDVLDLGRTQIALPIARQAPLLPGLGGLGISQEDQAQGLSYLFDPINFVGPGLLTKGAKGLKAASLAARAASRTAVSTASASLAVRSAVRTAISEGPTRLIQAAGRLRSIDDILRVGRGLPTPRGVVIRSADSMAHALPTPQSLMAHVVDAGRGLVQRGAGELRVPPQSIVSQGADRAIDAVRRAADEAPAPPRNALAREADRVASGMARQAGAAPPPPQSILNRIRRDPFMASYATNIAGEIGAYGGGLTEEIGLPPELQYVISMAAGAGVSGGTRRALFGSTEHHSSLAFAQNSRQFGESDPPTSTGRSKALPHTVREATEAWMGRLTTRGAPTSNEHYLYQHKYAGPTEYLVHGGGKSIWADGIRIHDGMLLECKHVGNPRSTPFTTARRGYEPIVADVEDEFYRYGAVINDPTNPFRGLEVITNDPVSAAFFETMLITYNVPGRVVVRE